MTTIQTASAEWRDVAKLVGKRVVSSWIGVSEAAIEHFEQAAYLAQEDAKFDLSAYPEGLVEGFHLLALLDYLVGQVSFIESDRWEGWNYGLDHVRFTHPVTTADRVRVQGEISGLDERGSAVLVTYDCQMEVEGVSKPALVATWKVLWRVDEREAGRGE